MKQRCINVVQTLCNVVSTLCNVVSTLFQRRALTSYQRSATLKIRRRILFHFQRRINVISTLIHNIKATLIQRWNVGWEWFWKLFEKSQHHLTWKISKNKPIEGRLFLLINEQKYKRQIKYLLIWSKFVL